MPQESAQEPQLDQRRTRRVRRLAARAVPLGRVGAQPGPGRGHTKSPQDRAVSGNRSAYWVRRIARDRPDILERMQAGEFTTVQAAAKAAGLLRQPTLVERLLRLWQRASPTERDTVTPMLGLETPEPPSTTFAALWQDASQEDKVHIVLETHWWFVWQARDLQKAIIQEAVMLSEKRGIRPDGTPLSRSRR